MGDIIKIVDSNGKSVGSYEYDAWGVATVNDLDGSGIAEINPIRYRGYYWDAETGLYYLNTRYYDPVVGRFIKMDEISILNRAKHHINGLNLFAYCLNNPKQSNQICG